MPTNYWIKLVKKALLIINSSEVPSIRYSLFLEHFITTYLKNLQNKNATFQWHFYPAVTGSNIPIGEGS
ncbi:transcriptional regulator, LysR domain protein [Bacillus pseudomycoides]|nr:transcriptional regulator, LysR domain protein [Bacillus pseudomycoides]